MCIDPPRGIDIHPKDKKKTTIDPDEETHVNVTTTNVWRDKDEVKVQ